MKNDVRLLNAQRAWADAEAKVEAAVAAESAASMESELRAAAAAEARANADTAFEAFLASDCDPAGQAALDAETDRAEAGLAAATAAAIAVTRAQTNTVSARDAAQRAAAAYTAAKADSNAVATAAVFATTPAQLPANDVVMSVEWKMRLLITTLVIAGFAVAGSFFYLVLKKSSEGPVAVTKRMKGEPLGLDEASAQVFCEENIRRVAKDPETVRVPFVLNRGRSGTYEFNWDSQTSLVRMRNGLGLEVAVRASCSVSATTGAIMSLTVDGQKIK